MSDKQQFFRLRQLILPQFPLWVLAFGLGVLTVASVLGLLMVAGWFVSMAGVASVLATAGLAYASVALWIRSFAVVRTLARYGDLMVSHHAVFALLRDLRVRFFARLAGLPSRQRHMDRANSAETMHRLVGDIDTLNEFTLRLLAPCVVSVFAVLGFGVCVFMLMPSGSLWVLLPIFVAMLLSVSIMMWGKSLANAQSTLGEQRKTTLLTALPALVQLILWDKWTDKTAELATLDKKYDAITNKSHALKRKSALMVQVLVGCAVVMLLALVQLLFIANVPTPFTAETLNDNLGVNPATVLALTFGLFGLTEIIMAMTGEPLALGRSLLAKQRLNALVPDVKGDDLQAFTWDGSPLTLTLDKVAVKMPHAIQATPPMTASVNSDRVLLITGVSGAGKSTLLNTLAGEIATDSGEIRLNGVPYETLDFGRSLGYLGQWVDIFDASLADNLRLGKPSATDDELFAVLDQVNLLAWVKAQPKGLATPLGEYGMAVSGGQARRIALARLLLADKAILLLDEPFAGLDKDTCQKVWHSLTQKQIRGEIGLLIISTHQITDEMKGSQVLNVG